MSTTDETEENPLSLFEQLSKGISFVNDDGDADDHPGVQGRNNYPKTTTSTPATNRYIQAIQIFEKLQAEIQSAAIFSSNESLNDVSTSSLALLAVEYHMAKACIQLPYQSSKERWGNVTRAMEYFHLFLSRCNEYESLLESDVQEPYEKLLVIHEAHHSSLNNHNNTDDDHGTSSAYDYKIPPQTRDEKIQTYKLTKTISSQIANYKSKLQQRKRLSLSEEEVLDGYDHDSLLRTLYLQEINLHALDSISEIHSNSLELQMLQMSMQHEERMNHERQYRHGGGDQQPSNRNSHMNNRRRQQPPTHVSNKPMTLTHITQDPVTNQLLFQKEVVQKTIFRPSWNQPTMSLDELAQKEIEGAKERAERQKQAEEENKFKPRRYEYLVRDGLEDDAKLVDASAKVDREWDDWKDDNPRGSGNKMGDVGDRNI